MVDISDITGHGESIIYIDDLELKVWKESPFGYRKFSADEDWWVELIAPGVGDDLDYGTFFCDDKTELICDAGNLTLYREGIKLFRIPLRKIEVIEIDESCLSLTIKMEGK